MYRRSICMAGVFCASLWTWPALATPIQYTVQFTPGSFIPLDPFLPEPDPLGLTGSQFTVVYTWDASPLTPTFDAPASGALRFTVWPGVNTTITLTVTGSGSADGVYAGGSDSWQLGDNTPVHGDTVQFPNSTFDLSGQIISIGNLIAHFPDAFHTPAPPGTVFPYPFQATDVTDWQNPIIEYLDLDFLFPISSSYDPDQNVSGSAGQASQVDAPSTFLLAVNGFIGVSALNRLRRRRRT